MTTTPGRRARRVSLYPEFRLEHSSTPFRWEETTGFYRWHAELSLSGPNSTSVLTIGAAALMSIDINECEDLVGDADYLTQDLGRLAHVAERTLARDYNNGLVDSVNRIILVEMVRIDPHWRGRKLGPALVKVAAHIIGGAGALYLTPAAQPESYEDRVTRASEAKVRKAWTNAGFRRRLESTYWLPLLDFGVAEAAEGRELISTLRFTREDQKWWAAKAAEEPAPTD